MVTYSSALKSECLRGAFVIFVIIMKNGGRTCSNLGAADLLSGDGVDRDA